jgi:hypothetical protein
MITSSKDNLHPDSTLFGDQSKGMKTGINRQRSLTMDITDRDGPVYRRPSGSFIYGGSSLSREALGTPPEKRALAEKMKARSAKSPERRGEIRKGNSVLFGNGDVDVESLKPKVVRWHGTTTHKDAFDDLGRRVLGNEKMKVKIYQ